MPTFTPGWNVNTCDGDHSSGVLPSSSTTFADTNGYSASGINSVRRYSCPASKLWLPRPSMSMPIMFMSSIVGLSPKKFEIGGVAPTESPAAISITPASWSVSAASPS